MFHTILTKKKNQDKNLTVSQYLKHDPCQRDVGTRREGVDEGLPLPVTGAKGEGVGQNIAWWYHVSVPSQPNLYAVLKKKRENKTQREGPNFDQNLTLN